MEKEFLKKIAKKGYTPAYVYFESILKKRLEFFNTQLKNEENFYYFFALLANNNPHILTRIIDKGTADNGKFKGFICSSYEEIVLIMNLINLKEGLYIDYHDPVMDRASLYKIKLFSEIFKDYNLTLIISVNSPYQFYLVNDIFEEEIRKNLVKIFIKISQEDIEDNLMKSVKEKGLKVGLHIYPGTNLQIAQKKYYEMIVEKLRERIFEPYKDYIYAVDLGGGFGINYEKCEPEDELIKFAINKISGSFKGVEKIIEPGRSIIAPAGVLLAKIKDAKIKNDILFLTVDTGFPNFARPYIYEQFHKVEILWDEKFTDFEEKHVLIGGFSMASQDFIYGEFKENPKCRGISPVGPVKMRVPKINSVEELIDTPVVIYCTGAYGYNMASRFSGRPKPMEILITGEDEKDYKAYTIREAEKEDGLFSGIPDIPKEIEV